jgi:hypothetical protein
MDVRVRMGDAIDPFQLANGVEAVIGYECQERSNPLSLTRTIHTSHARCDKAGEWVGGSLHCRRGRRRCCRRGILVILWMSLRVGIVPCVSKIDTLGLFLSLLKTWGSDTFDDSFTSTTCLYLSPSQLCLIKRESNFKHTHVHAEQDRVMCIGLSKTREQFQAYACACRARQGHAHRSAHAHW